MTKTCPHCKATVLSTSQPERITDEMLNAHIKALGDWTEPFTAERESGVAMDMDISQEDADQFNADERARLRIGYTAAFAATPAVGGEMLDAAQKAVMKYPYFTEREALEVAKAVVAAAPPASPLRGRDLDWQETFTDRGDGSKDQTGWEADSGFGSWYSVEQYMGSDSYGWETKFDCEVISDHDDPEQAKKAAQNDFAKRVLDAVSAPPPEQPQRNLGVASDSDRTTTVPDRTTDATPRNDPQEPTSRDSRERPAPPEQPAAYPSAEADEEHADLLRRLAAVSKEEK